MTFVDLLGLMMYIGSGCAIAVALLCIMTDWDGIEEPGTLLLAGIIVAGLGFWLRTGASIQALIGLALYLISFICGLATLIIVMAGGSAGAKSSVKDAGVMCVATFVFWILGWVVRSAVF